MRVCTSWQSANGLVVMLHFKFTISAKHHPEGQSHVEETTAVATQRGKLAELQMYA